MRPKSRSRAVRLKFFIWPPLFAGVTVRFVWLMLVALLFSLASELGWAKAGAAPGGLSQQWWWGHVESYGLCFITLGALFLYNVILEWRRARFDRELAAYGRSEAEPKLKHEVVLTLLRERNKRY